MQKIVKNKETEFQIMDKGKIKRYPTLQTILMVETTLQKNQDIPLKIAEVKRKLPKQIMHQTLALILEYLWRSGKIIYGPKGIQWIYAEPEHLQKMLQNGLEV